MFTKLPNNTGIYGLSAANPTESSWGTYCSPDDVVQGKHVGSCLGDLFSVNFIEDVDNGNVFESLNEQFKIIKTKTSLSHVMQWGDLSFQDDKVADYVSGPKLSTNLRSIKPIRRVGEKITEAAKMNSRTMKLQSLSAIYAREKSPIIFKEMMEEMTSMANYDSTFSKFDTTLKLTGNYDAENINFECLRTSIDTYEAKCGKFTDYGLMFAKNFAEACEKFSVEEIAKTISC